MRCVPSLASTSTPAPVTNTGPIRLGTRASQLARTQSALVGDQLASETGRTWTEVLIRTQGDDTTKPLDQPGSPGLFVSALRTALLAGEVDVIVHSYKDLPSAPAPGLLLAAVPPRESPDDVLVSRDSRRLLDLPAGASVGTSSPRRAAAVHRLRPDLIVRPIRGNVDSRIAKVRSGEYDATIVAAAGLARLGRLDEATERLDIVSAPAQGALAVECRSDDTVMTELLRRLDDPLARLTTAAEREVLRGIDAACTTAIGALAHYADGVLSLRAELAEGGHLRVAHASRALPIAALVEARALGLLVAGQLRGADQRGPVLLVRSDSNEADASALGDLGIGAVSDPYLSIVPTSASEGSEADPLLTLLGQAGSDSWLVATSPMTMPTWAEGAGFAELAAACRAAAGRGVRAGATGERTAATLRALGFDDVVVPAESSAAALVEAMAEYGPARALFPCGRLALRTLPDGLRRDGWEVHEGIVYDTQVVTETPPSALLLERGEVAVVVLRSPSAVRALLAHGRPHPAVLVVCGGDTTARAAREAGLAVAGVSSSPSSASVAVEVARVLGVAPQS
ncbi:MAG: hydroxymethylbilane synthase [Actinobacteria bacterium]|nr:hydroxymethylbilane synthase [Actinomycetota bacterium]